MNYYPHCNPMADISTSPDAQQFKYNGKVLAANRTIDNRSARRRASARVDRSFGLDLYDYHARQQDAKLGRFNSIDPLAEKDYGTSPYAYCKGNPVNMVDKDGKDSQYIICGNNITISTNIVLYGQYVTSEVAATVKTSLDANWGAIKSYEYNGQSYNVNWNFNISTATSKPPYKEKINYIKYNPGKNNCNFNETSSIKGHKHGTLYNGSG